MTDWRSYLVDSESLPADDYVRATYSLAVTHGADVREAAVNSLRIVTERSGNSAVCQLPAEGGAAVIHVGQPGRWTEVVFAIPSAYWSPAMGLARLQEILVSIVEYGFTEGAWLQRVDLPREHMARLRGPNLGVTGVRSRIGVPTRPLLAVEYGRASIENTRLDRSVLFDVLTGGFDMVVDDLLLPGVVGNDMWRDRVNEIAGVCADASAIGGTRKLFLASLHGTPTQIFRAAGQCLESSVAGVVVNANAVGFGVIQDLSNEFPELIIVTTNMGTGIMSRPPTYLDASSIHRVGIDEQIISKISRLAGADAVHAGTTGTECYDVPWGDSIRSLSQPLRAGNRKAGGVRYIEPSLRVAEGDLRYASMWPNVRLLGRDVVFEIPWRRIRDQRGTESISTWALLADKLATCRDTREAIDIYRSIAKRSESMRRELNEIDVVRAWGDA